MIRRSMPLAAAALLMLCFSCGQSRPEPTPRRHAYPRAELYDTVYAPVQEAPLDFAVNSSAEVATDSGRRWLTIAYPAYDATLYVTFSKASTPIELESTLANRRERISLNLNGAQATTAHIASAAGFESALVEAPGHALPLQFVATDGKRWVVSGAVQMDNPLPYDSVSPVVGAMRRDLVRALSLVSEK